ncbi:MAG: hypothetical protein V1756_00960 [Patescibacteria group bacterium]
MESVGGDKKRKYLFIAVILVFTAFGAFFAYSQSSKEKTGIIEGSLGYPSEFIPADMRVCAEDISTKQQYCTGDHIQNTKYTYGVGYKFEIPKGKYRVFATLPNWVNYRAYYSEYVTCGLGADCISHSPIVIEVKADNIINNIDPQDWYNF